MSTSTSARRVATAILLGLTAASTAFAAAAPGGFVESATSTTARPKLTRQQIQSFMPSRGRFTFPAPYSTEGVRLTNADDCNGADCVMPVGYSYWRNINAHAGSSSLYVFLGLSTGRGGTGPTLFRVDKASGRVTNVGPLMPAGTSLRNASGEGWYFSASMPTSLYVMDGPRLRRLDVESKRMTTVFDVSTEYGADRTIWQVHSSNDDRVHSATLRSRSSSAALGCVVYNEPERRFRFFAKRGAFDECQIDKSGRWLVIKDNVDGTHGEDNRIIDLDSGSERLLYDQNGAPGHSDMGYGVLVGGDNWAQTPGMVRMWDLSQSLTRSSNQGYEVYRSADWSADFGHLSFANAAPGVAPSRSFACASNATSTRVARADEVVCFRLDDSREVLVVAPVLTDLGAPGGGDTYSKRPKGNIDRYGEYFVWTTNLGGNRLDAVLVRVPAHELGVASGAGGVGFGVPPAPGSPGGSAGSHVPFTGPTLLWGGQVGAAVHRAYEKALREQQGK